MLADFHVDYMTLWGCQPATDPSCFITSIVDDRPTHSVAPDNGSLVVVGDHGRTGWEEINVFEDVLLVPLWQQHTK